MAKPSYNSQNTNEFNINLKKLNIPDFAYHNGKEGKKWNTASVDKYVMGTMKNGFPGGSMIKNLPANVGHASLIPGSGRCPGAGKHNPLKYSCLKNPMNGGTWWATAHRVTESRTQLSTHTKKNYSVRLA